MVFATDNIDTEKLFVRFGDFVLESSPLEINSDGDDAVIILTSDLWGHLEKLDDCAYFRTEPGCLEVETKSFYIAITA